MPKLREGERMAKCQSVNHARHRRQKYFLVRTYYNKLEQTYCQGCLEVLRWNGYAKRGQDFSYELLVPEEDLKLRGLL